MDRLTKEIAVKDALLKLKVSASEPNSWQQVSAKESAYKQAEEIEQRLKKALAELTPGPSAETLWWRQASMREIVFPSLGEGKQLSPPAKRKWRWHKFGFYMLLVIYVALGTVGLITVSLQGSVRLALFFLAFFSLWMSISFRRSAHMLSLGQSPKA